MSDQGVLPFDPFESRVEREFNDWIRSPDGLHVYLEAVDRCYRLRKRGVKHYGVKAIFESIRYDWTVGLLGDGEFRLNNNHTSLLARFIMAKHPQLEGFFEIRVLRGI